MMRYQSFIQRGKLAETAKLANLAAEPNMTAKLTSTLSSSSETTRPAARGARRQPGGAEGAHRAALPGAPPARSPAPETRLTPPRPAADSQGPRRRGASHLRTRPGTHPLLRGIRRRGARCPDSQSHADPDSRCREEPVPQTPPLGRRAHSAPFRRPDPAHTQGPCGGGGRGVAGGESGAAQGHPELPGGLTGSRLTPGICSIPRSGLVEICSCAFRLLH